VKVGDLVLLVGGIWSSYNREGEVGLLLETSMATNPSTNFSRVLWQDGESNLCKTGHLQVVNETR
jgi:hypothetical protein